MRYAVDTSPEPVSNGAANLGDIGSLFPSGDEQYRGAASLDLLWEAYREVREAGWELVNADCVLVGEEPRIGDVRDEMGERLAGALVDGLPAGWDRAIAAAAKRLGVHLKEPSQIGVVLSALHSNEDNFALARLAKEWKVTNVYVAGKPPVPARDDGRLRVAVAVSGGQAEVVVEDDGPGIPGFALDKVFDRFFSLQRPDTGRRSSGLGLTLVREVATLHGGAVGLSNRAAGGASVRMESNSPLDSSTDTAVSDGCSRTRCCVVTVPAVSA